MGLFNQTLLVLPALSDIAGDLRCADNTTVPVLHRGNSEGDVHERAILAPADGFDMVHALALSELGENIQFFVLELIRNKKRGHGLADGFFGRIAEEPFGALVPTRD